MKKTQQGLTGVRALFALFLVASGAAMAAPPATAVKDANAGLDALNKGENATAVRLFTRVLNGGKLAPADVELAYVKRAQAYIGQGMNDPALADLDKAFAIDPNDKDIATLRQKAGWKPPEAAILEMLTGLVQQLAASGSITYTATFHDSAANSEFSEARSWEVGAFVPHADTCRLDFHFKATRQGAVFADKNAGLALHDVAALQMISKAKLLDGLNKDAGHANWTANTDPVLTALIVSLPGGTNEFDFKDEASAKQAAAALLSGSHLCGGAPAPMALAENEAPAKSQFPAASVGPDAAAAPVPVIGSAVSTPAAQILPAGLTATVPTAAAPLGLASPAASVPAAKADPETAQTSVLNQQIRDFNAAQDAQFKAEQEKYLAAQQAYEKQKKQVEEETVALAAKKAADDAVYSAQLTNWQQRVTACKAGDTAACTATREK